MSSSKPMKFKDGKQGFSKCIILKPQKIGPTIASEHIKLSITFVRGAITKEGKRQYVKMNLKISTFSISQDLFDKRVIPAVLLHSSQKFALC